MINKKELTEEQKVCFAKSESLAEAFFMVDRGIEAHSRFVHYTTLPSVVQIITSGRWWLTHASSDSLNDVQEAKKYGNPELLGRMYQASFAYGSAENAAMWGLYCPGNPCGVMISLDGKAMRSWFNDIRGKKSRFCLEYPAVGKKPARHVALRRSQIECADARDVIYAATDFADTSTCGKNRSDTLFWFNARTEKIENLALEINDDKFTGWVKDAEWRQENESRIAVRVKKIDEALPKNLSINIPDSVLKSMRFTLSPWLKDESYDGVAKVIRALAMKVHETKLPQTIVSRSTITGALESWRERYCGNMKNEERNKK